MCIFLIQALQIMCVYATLSVEEKVRELIWYITYLHIRY